MIRSIHSMATTRRRRSRKTTTRKPVFKAPEDQVAIFEAAQSNMERRIARTLITIQDVLRDGALTDQVVDAIGRRDWNEALRLIGLGYADNEADAVNRLSSNIYASVWSTRARPWRPRSRPSYLTAPLERRGRRRATPA